MYLGGAIPVPGMKLIHITFYLRRILQYMMYLILQLPSSQTMYHNHTMLMVSDSQFKITYKLIQLYSPYLNILQAPASRYGGPAHTWVTKELPVPAGAQ